MAYGGISIPININPTKSFAAAIPFQIIIPGYEADGTIYIDGAAEAVAGYGMVAALSRSIRIDGQAEAKAANCYAAAGTVSVAVEADAVAGSGTSITGVIRLKGETAASAAPLYQAAGVIRLLTEAAASALTVAEIAGVIRLTGQAAAAVIGLYGLGSVISISGFAAAEVFRPIIPESHETWCLNLMTGAHSMYSDFLFIAASGDNLLDGTHRFQNKGVTDNGAAIDAEVQLNPVDFGAPMHKYMHDAYIEMRGEGGGVFVTQVDEASIYEYPVATPGRNGLHTERVKLARGVKGNIWRVGFKSVAGSPFNLQKITVKPLASQRSR